MLSELSFDQLGFVVKFELPDSELSDFEMHMAKLLLLSALSFDQLGFVVQFELPDCQLSDFGMHMATLLLLSELSFDQFGFVQFELPDCQRSAMYLVMLSWLSEQRFDQPVFESAYFEPAVFLSDGQQFDFVQHMAMLLSLSVPLMFDQPRCSGSWLSAPLVWTRW